MSQKPVTAAGFHFKPASERAARAAAPEAAAVLQAEPAPLAGTKRERSGSVEAPVEPPHKRRPEAPLPAPVVALSTPVAPAAPAVAEEPDRSRLLHTAGRLLERCSAAVEASAGHAFPLGGPALYALGKAFLVARARKQLALAALPADVATAAHSLSSPAVAAADAAAFAIPPKPNPKNVEHAKRLEQLDADVAAYTAELAQWEAIEAEVAEVKGEEGQGGAAASGSSSSSSSSGGAEEIDPLEAAAEEELAASFLARYSGVGSLVSLFKTELPQVFFAVDGVADALRSTRKVIERADKVTSVVSLALRSSAFQGLDVAGAAAAATAAAPAAGTKALLRTLAAGGGGSKPSAVTSAVASRAAAAAGAAAAAAAPSHHAPAAGVAASSSSAAPAAAPVPALDTPHVLHTASKAAVDHVKRLALRAERLAAETSTLSFASPAKAAGAAGTSSGGEDAAAALVAVRSPSGSKSAVSASNAPSSLTAAVLQSLDFAPPVVGTGEGGGGGAAAAAASADGDLGGGRPSVPEKTPVIVRKIKGPGTVGTA